MRLNRNPRDFERIGETQLDMITRTVEIANAEYWLSTLVQTVQADHAGHQLLAQFFANNPGWELVKNRRNLHPCDTLRVLGGKSFIGRREFRDHVKAMEQVTGMKALVVTSGHRSVGKTYSAELIQFLALLELNGANSGSN